MTVVDAELIIQAERKCQSALEQFGRKLEAERGFNNANAALEGANREVVRTFEKAGLDRLIVRQEKGQYFTVFIDEEGEVCMMEGRHP